MLPWRRHDDSGDEQDAKIVELHPDTVRGEIEIVDSDDAALDDAADAGTEIEPWQPTSALAQRLGGAAARPIVLPREHLAAATRWHLAALWRYLRWLITHPLHPLARELRPVARGIVVTWMAWRDWVTEIDLAEAISTAPKDSTTRLTLSKQRAEARAGHRRVSFFVALLILIVAAVVYLFWPVYLVGAGLVALVVFDIVGRRHPDVDAPPPPRRRTPLEAGAPLSGLTTTVIDRLREEGVRADPAGAMRVHEGIEYRIDLMHEDAIKPEHLRSLERHMAARPMSIRLINDGRDAGISQLRMQTEDPLAGARSASWIDTGSISCLDYLPLGRATGEQPCALRLAGVHTAIIGRTRCIAGDTRIYLPLTDEHVRVDELVRRGQPITVLAWNGERFIPARTDGAPFLKGEAEMYEVQCSDGATIRVTGQHRFLTPTGWRQLDDVHVGQLLAAAPHVRPAGAVDDLCGSLEDAPRSTGTGAGCPGGCSTCRRLDDRRLHQVRAGARAVVPAQVDALGRSPFDSPQDARACGRGCSRACRRGNRHAKNLIDQIARRVILPGCHGDACSSSRSSGWCRAARRSQRSTAWSHTSVAGDLDQGSSLDVPASAAHSWSATAGQLRASATQGCPEIPRTTVRSQGSTRLRGNADAPRRGGLRLARTAAGGRSPLRVVDAPGTGLALHATTRSVAATRLQGTGSGLWPEGSGALRDAPRDSIRWNTIRAIRPVGMAKFYDLTVPGPDNYVAEGLVNHNSGKTEAAMWTIIDRLSACRDAVIWGIDLQEGPAFPMWRGVIQETAYTPEDAETLLRMALDEIARRKPILVRLAESDDDDEAGSTWTPDLGHYLFIFIDEFALTSAFNGQGSKKDEPNLMELIEILIRIGLKYGVHLVLASQKTGNSDFGSSIISSQVSVKILLACMERDTVTMLSTTQRDQGWSPHHLQPFQSKQDPRDAGVAYIESPVHHLPERYKFEYWPEGEVKRRARQRLADGLPSLDDSVSNAIDDAVEVPQILVRVKASFERLGFPELAPTREILADLGAGWDSSKLAEKLKPYGLEPTQRRIDPKANPVRGYLRIDLDDALRSL